ncbi:hypothetical protein LWI29_010833 [Acer saccharum]|uniref:U-box domain-containing protein n=1 Tax=Acer saccharum TaxID=4024 RepID=A0AA39RYI4_ACESA|nr:hypothetical protein LWI29_010833 [Acer saccharum]
MHNPVTLENGLTFEHEVIDKLFKECKESGRKMVCPLTQKQVKSTYLNPSIALQNTIEEWSARNEAAQLDLAHQSLNPGSPKSDIVSNKNQTILGELALNNDVKVMVVRNVGSSLVNIMKSGNIQAREAALKALNQISSCETSAKV